tara:strand:- start:519 stop:851 length:333 start_codon:yes stop_codon:yes gene_type:complete
MNTLDARLKHIIREQLSLLVDECGKKELILGNIERAWREMPVDLNPRELTRLTGACDLDGDYLEETRLDEPGELDVNENSAGEGAHGGWYDQSSCCPIGHPGTPGPQGVK